ncbi:hypothetical protein [Vibrio harveyi]|nr:hypothetical protein [Vibrio harveyi]
MRKEKAAWLLAPLAKEIKRHAPFKDKPNNYTGSNVSNVKIIR